MFVACCVMRVVCWLLSADCLVPDVCCSLVGECWILFLFVVRWLFLFACCSLYVGCCMVVVVCWSLFAVRCVLLVG